MFSAKKKLKHQPEDIERSDIKRPRILGVPKQAEEATGELVPWGSGGLQGLPAMSLQCSEVRGKLSSCSLAIQFAALHPCIPSPDHTNTCWGGRLGPRTVARRLKPRGIAVCLHRRRCVCLQSLSSGDGNRSHLCMER